MAEFKMRELSAEEIELNKQRAKQAEEAFTPPEGKVLVGVRAFCPIHGDITKASKVIHHTLFVKNPEGEVVPAAYSDTICIACLSEMWRKHIKENFPKDEKGEPVPIRIAPVFGEPPKEEKAEGEKAPKDEEAPSTEQ